MSKGRSVSYTYNDSWLIFTPPKPIAFYAALSSCYTRYRLFSKYIMIIDVDEFVAFNPSASKTSLHGRRQWGNKLVDFADSFFASHPTFPALKFTPVLKLNCHTGSETSGTRMASENIAEASASSTTTKGGTGNKARGKACVEQHRKPSFVLPRLDRWVHNDIWRGNEYEGKLLMRTEAVRNFYIHFVTQLEPPFQRWASLREDPASFYVNRSIAVLMHYKMNQKRTKDIWGSVLFISEDLQKIEVIGVDVCEKFGISLQYGDDGNKGNKIKGERGSGPGPGPGPGNGLHQHALIEGDLWTQSINKSSSLASSSSFAPSEGSPVYCPSSRSPPSPHPKGSIHDRFYDYLLNKTSTLSSARLRLWYAQYSEDQPEPINEMERYPKDCIADFHQSNHHDRSASGPHPHEDSQAKYVQCIPSYSTTLFKKLFRRYRARMMKSHYHHYHHQRPRRVHQSKSRSMSTSTSTSDSVTTPSPSTAKFT